MRHVRGTLFLDYVRMLRRVRVQPETLHPDDVKYVTTERIEPGEWYPMAVFERLGLAILRDIVGTETDAIRLWGRSRLETIVQAWPDLLVAGDTLASMRQFHGFFSAAFDYETLALPVLEPGRAHVRVGYGMSPAAETAAAWQTAGFFEAIVTSSRGRAVHSRLQPYDRAQPGPATFEVAWQVDAPVASAPQSARPRVLVVDDEALVAAALRRILASVAQVSVASNALEAIALLEQQPFDGVLSDFKMPGHDGLWLLGEVARRWPHVHRVLHSSAVPHEAELARQTGTVHLVLEKPAALDVIRDAFARPAG